MYNKEEYFQDIKHFVRVFIHTPNMHVPFILQFKAVLHEEKKKNPSSFPTYIKFHVWQMMKHTTALYYSNTNITIYSFPLKKTSNHKLDDNDRFHQIEVKKIIYYMTMW